MMGLGFYYVFENSQILKKYEIRLFPEMPNGKMRENTEKINIALSISASGKSIYL